MWVRTQAGRASLVTATDFLCFDVNHSLGSALVTLCVRELPFLIISYLGPDNGGIEGWW